MIDRDIEVLKRRLAAGDESLRAKLGPLCLRVGRPVHEAWQGLPLTHAIDWEQARATLTPACFHQLGDDLAHLNAPTLLQHTPRDPRGHWPLRQRILLTTYDSPHPLRADQHYALLIKTPERRRDPQVLTLTLDLAYPRRYRHRWNRARWFWDSRIPLTQKRLWGAHPIDLDLLQQSQRDDKGRLRRRLQRRCQNTQATHHKVHLCVLMQEQHDYLGALALFDIEADPSILRAMRTPEYHDDTMHGSLRAHWPAWLAESLRRAAPWRFRQALQHEVLRQRRWVAGKSGRRRSIPKLFLSELPTGPYRSKPCLTLSAQNRDGEGPRLSIEFTGSPRRVALHSWQRPEIAEALRLQRAEER